MQIFTENGEIDIPNNHCFLGECCGVALVPRGEKDNHILFVILGEDDEQWFLQSYDGKYNCHGTSSYWMDDLLEQLNQAKAWLKRNAEKDPSGYGYCFKTR